MGANSIYFSNILHQLLFLVFFSNFLYAKKLLQISRVEILLLKSDQTDFFFDLSQCIFQNSFSALCILEVVSMAASAALLLLQEGLAGRRTADKHHFAPISSRILDRAIISIKRIFFHSA